MVITRETDYALRLLRALSPGGRHTMKDLCQAEEVPQQFAYKIIRKLAQAGLVENLRGSTGGCQLKADLKEVTLHDLLTAMGEDYKLTACMEAGYQCSWEACHSEGCRVHCQLAKIQQTFEKELQAHSLHSLMFG